MTPLLLLFARALATAADEPQGLTLADLAPYRAALSAGPTTAPPLAATFRALWDHPERYRGRRVRVEGRLVRRFRQGAYGTFPPLVEAWALAPPGGPLCLVFPDAPGPDLPLGASIRFEGTYLKTIRYQGGDVPRLAPLVVGDRPPVVTAPAPARGLLDEAPGLDRALGLGVALLFALVLARRHLQRPVSRRRLDPRIDPEPEFLDGA